MKINIKLIKQILDNKEWNQSDLADKMGVTRQSVSIQFKNGVTTLKTIEKYARALKVSAKTLIT
jgi:transcriptional regulator with XRE-family HTH domain